MKVTTMRRHSFNSVSARCALRVAGIVGFVALALCFDGKVLTRFHIMNTAKAEDNLIGTFHPRKLAADATSPGGVHFLLGVEGVMPDLDGAIGWLNSTPLSSKSLRGKVVLVNFWTYTCINSLRPLPYVKNWASKYHDAGFVVIGVHTPEFSFEHEPMNVDNAVRTLNVTFPVAIDSKIRIWRSFNNQAWPAQYLVDAKGRIRYHHFGEGDYGEIERVIQELVTENGATGLASGTTSVSGVGIEAAPDWTDERSPETYIGYRQAQNFANFKRHAGIGQRPRASQKAHQIEGLENSCEIPSATCVSGDDPPILGWHRAQGIEIGPTSSDGIPLSAALADTMFAEQCHRPPSPSTAARASFV
jgi:thiol-disulfide isomerase/thioredoxin